LDNPEAPSARCGSKDVAMHRVLGLLKRVFDNRYRTLPDLWQRLEDYRRH
jgi:hypothetical protein